MENKLESEKPDLQKKSGELQWLKHSGVNLLPVTGYTAALRQKV
ncbi:MAG: hypothetical protein AAF434_19995 [Pseudomonadota bacterium]